MRFHDELDTTRDLSRIFIFSQEKLIELVLTCGSPAEDVKERTRNASSERVIAEVEE